MITRAQILGTYPRSPDFGMFPYGKRMIVPLCLSVVALTLSMVASFHCSFFVIHKQFSQVMTGFGFQHTTEGSIKVGIWRTHEDWEYSPLADGSRWNDQYATDGWETYDDAWIAGSPKCVNWDLSSLGKVPDRPAKFARMFSVLIILLGIPLVVLIIAYALYHPIFGISQTLAERLSELPRRQDLPEFSMVIVLAVCCGLEGLLNLILLSFLATEACSEDRVDSCKLSTAGYMSILTSFMWWGCMIAVWVLAHDKVSPAATEGACIDKDIGRVDEDDNESTESSEEERDEENGTATVQQQMECTNRQSEHQADTR